MANERKRGIEVESVHVGIPTAAVSTQEPARQRGKKPMNEEERVARKTALLSESKPDKFSRLAIYRMPKAVKAIKALGNLANRSQYEWTQEQANKVVATLEKAVQGLRDKFAGNKENGESFTF